MRWLAAWMAVVAAWPATATELVVDAKARRVTVAGKVAKQGIYKQLEGAIEYVLVTTGGKEYETLFTTAVEPAALAAAFTQIGLRAGGPATEVDGELVGPRGDVLQMSVRWFDGRTNRQARVEELTLDTTTGGPMPATLWVATGTSTINDPKTGRPVLEATVTRNLISFHQLDRAVLAQNPTPGASDNGRYKPALERLPPEGTTVILVFEPVMLARFHVRVTGTVQGVGYREFTRRAARGLGVRGWVRNLPNGMVEVLAEGMAESLAVFRQQLVTGPRGAKVEAVRDVAFPANEVVGEFVVRPTPGLGLR